MADEHKITTRGLSFYYGQEQVLKSLDLDIPKDQIFALLGPARSGKTTFLRVLNRLSDLVPDTRLEGQVLLDGQDIYQPGLDVAELRRRVGMVFDLPTPLPMSIFDNVAYGPRLKGVREGRVLAELAEESLRAAVIWDEVKDRLHTSALQLSGGQQQRLCIARVLALRPEVILLDQPASGLDPISTAKIEDSLRQLSARYTIVLVPHNVQQAARVGDQVAFLLMGELVEVGPGRQMFTRPKDQRTADYITGRFG